MATSDKLTEDYLTCVICAEVFTDPTTLHCDHTFCRSCLLKYTNTQPDAIQAKSLPCPSCRQMTRVTSPEKPVEDWVNQVKPSRLIQGLIDDFGPHKSNQAKLSKKTGFVCAEHKDKQVELYCKDCNKAICHICCSIRHRQCKSVGTMETFTTEVRATLEKKRNLVRNKVKLKLQQLAQKKDRMDEVKKHAKSAEGEIKQASHNIQDEIRRKEKKLLDDLSKVKDKQTEDLRAGLVSIEKAIKGHRQQFEFIDLALKSESQEDMFAIYGSWRESADDTGKEEETPAMDRIRFTQDKNQLMTSVDEQPLGEINVIDDSHYRTSSVVLQNTVDCWMKNDSFRTSLIDVVLLTVSGGKVIVTADHYNTSIKAFYRVKSKSYTKVQKLTTFPWQMARISDNEIVVSGSSKLVFVKFSPDPVITVTVDTNNLYYGFAYLTPHKLICGALGTIDVLGRDGKVSRSVSNALKLPYYIHVTKKVGLLVIDNKTNCVISMTMEGKVNFTYNPIGSRHLKYPRGITTMNNGDILIADCINHKVIQLTESGQFVRDLLTQRDGLDSPRGLYLDEDGILYVALERYVKVYQLV